MRRIAPVLLAVASLAVAAPSTAQAGIYPVHSCEPEAGDVNNSWVSSRDTWMLLTYANCPPGAEPKDRARGLVTSSMENVASPDTSMPRGSRSAMTFYAPPGASLARVTYRHSLCGMGGFRAGLANAAGQWLHYAGPGWCGSFDPNPNTLDLYGTTALRLQTVCAESSCRMGSMVNAWATLRSATVWVQDFTPPSVAGGGPLTEHTWVGGIVPAPVHASDNVGIREAQVLLGDKQVAAAIGVCNYTYAVPCGAASRSLTANTRQVADGPYWATFRARDSAGNDNGASYWVYVDNTPPAAPRAMAVAGGDAWRSTNDFAVRWSNPPQGSAAPLMGARTAICPPTTPPESFAGCARGSRDVAGTTELSGLRVPGPGQWIARVWLVDAAKNEDPLAAEEVPLRFDPTAPDAALAEIDPQDPQRVSLMARDATSGLATGEIEIRRQGSVNWISLPAEPTPTGFTAIVDDAALPDGLYDIRARAVDRADNERTTTSRVSGATAHLVLPLRVPTILRAGKPRQVWGRHGRRRTVLARTATAAYGSSFKVRGTLAVPGGNPLIGSDVDVLERTALPDQPWVRVGVARTDERGRFGYRVRPGPSRTVLFRYAGTNVIRPQTAAVEVRIRATTSLDVDRRAVVNGEDVVFRGRVRGAPMPSSGKLVQLQAYSRGGWRTFATPRARARTHRWSYRYRFTATRGSVQYRFRAVVPAEGGFPFVRGASRRVTVSVRGL